MSVLDNKPYLLRRAIWGIHGATIGLGFGVYEAFTLKPANWILFSFITALFCLFAGAAVVIQLLLRAEKKRNRETGDL
jgi:hypothetical protein